MAKVLGLGGAFFKVDDPQALGEWYERWLGMPVEPPYGASLKPETVPPGGFSVWGPFKSSTDYFDPSPHAFMINLMVDDVDGALRQVAEGGAEVVGEVLDEPYGKFGWFIDPAGIKVELWQPKPGEDEE